MSEHEEEGHCFVGDKMAQGLTQDQALAAMREWEQTQIEKEGWFVHFVSGDKDYALGANYHTHGIAENLDHPDLQICFPMSGQTVLGLLHNIVNRIKAGEEFLPDHDYADIAGNDYLVRMVEATEGERPVLRVIIPGKNGVLDRAGIEEPFNEQYADIP